MEKRGFLHHQRANVGRPLVSMFSEAPYSEAGKWGFQICPIQSGIGGAHGGKNYLFVRELGEGISVFPTMCYRRQAHQRRDGCVNDVSVYSDFHTFGSLQKGLMGETCSSHPHVPRRLGMWVYTHSFSSPCHTYLHYCTAVRCRKGSTTVPSLLHNF